MAITYVLLNVWMADKFSSTCMQFLAIATVLIICLTVLEK